ncbi:DNA repair protein RecN [Natranaerobius trueperi]|uniref:DNA repair protein RecN n=1 Tax=Natranaerobius trueperi TaxID=759412 RepID=A0A226C0N1_9FIRM|nr:DNA repair protein RecN [Natranaerobius trueperi]OWZ84009.1 DNA repair protein RecN [Natranaerobius trueperi]
MLVHLDIKNFALIEHLVLEPCSKLNILTGETGAGKTIILDALGLILGERASSSFIRTGCNKATVQGVFKPSFYKKKIITQLLDEWNLPKEDDDSLILTREISLNKSICKINDHVVTLSKFKVLGKQLVDMHGQHEHQSLLSTDKHLDLLDAFGGHTILSVRKEISNLYDKFENVQTELDNLVEDPKERARKLELLAYQKQEIEDANLTVKEEEELTDLRKKLINVERLREAVGYSYQRLYAGDDYQSSVIDSLGLILDKLSSVVDVDDNLNNINKQLENSMIQLEEISREVSDYLEAIDINPIELQEVEERLSIYNELKRKYGNSVVEINHYFNKITAELEYLERAEDKRSELQQKRDKIKRKIIELSEQLREMRYDSKERLEQLIQKHLSELAMGKIQFAVKIFELDEITTKGMDKLEFQISPNPGEPLKPLNKVASGGELSRIMLALKSVFSEIDNIGTMIFDEIDTGISGDAAQKVADKLKQLSDINQVLCVTHLPQVASKADKHLKLTKKELDGRTFTVLEELDENQKINEIAKIIDGDKPSETSIKHAKNMIFGSN